MEDSIEPLESSGPRISLKDHKKNFHENPFVKLICPTKSDIGGLLDTILPFIIPVLSLKMWFDSEEWICWFNSIESIPILLSSFMLTIIMLVYLLFLINLYVFAKILGLIARDKMDIFFC